MGGGKADSLCPSRLDFGLSSLATLFVLSDLRFFDWHRANGESGMIRPPFILINNALAK